MINLLSLLDDIAATMDDVAVMTKVALKKTSVLMTDDLAVNAAVVQGVDASRELPIVWSIFLGSLVNKAICICTVSIINYFYPPILIVILFLGGCYLAFEGADKVYEKILNRRKKETNKTKSPPISEKDKIWGAIKTDFVLSMEIIVLAQTGLSGDFVEILISLTFVGLAASLLIYGLVALIVKIDDLGLLLVSRGYSKMGLTLVKIMPKMMKSLGVVGTIAMLMVAGGIFSHTFHVQIYFNEHLQNLIFGLCVGTLLIMIQKSVKKLS
jgi:uncharacterized protein